MSSGSPVPTRLALYGWTAFSIFTPVAAAQIVHDPGYVLSTELTGLSNPQGVDVDASGNVYLADSAAGRILKGSGGSYAPLITGIPVSEFFGLNIGPLAIHVAPDQTLWYGEGGRDTGVEQVHRVSLDGGMIQTLDPTPDGGNWSGITVDPVTGRLYASSANRDRIFTSDPTSGFYGTLTLLADTSPSALISPTGLLLDGGILYAGFYGPWGAEGQIATFNAQTGQILNPSFATGMPGLTSLDRLGNGRLLATQVGTTDGEGVLWSIDPVTGEKTMLVSELTAATGVAVAPDGTTIYLVDMGAANEQQGRLYKLTLVPAPASAALLALPLLWRRRRSAER